jgi:hypothetical protein
MLWRVLAGLPSKVHHALRILTTFPQCMRLTHPLPESDSLIHLAARRRCEMRWIASRLALHFRNSGQTNPEWES